MATTTLKTTVIAAQSLTTDFSTGGIDVSKFVRYSFQAVFTIGGGTSAGNMMIEVSDDGVNFTPYSGTSKAISSSSTSEMWGFTNTGEQYARVSWDNTSGTGITCDIILNGMMEQK